MYIYADAVLLEKGWAKSVRLRLDGEGRIAEIITDTQPQARDERHGILSSVLTMSIPTLFSVPCLDWLSEGEESKTIFGVGDM